MRDYVMRLWQFNEFFVYLLEGEQMFPLVQYISYLILPMI